MIACGPGTYHPDTGKLIPSPLKEGDLVLIADVAQTGEKVEYNGESHLVVGLDAVCGIFDGEDPTVDSFKPIGDRVLIATKEAATETTSGIALAMDEKDDNQGEVLAAGPGKLSAMGELMPMEVAAGESVLYDRYAAAEVNIEDRRFIVVPAENCYAKW